VTDEEKYAKAQDFIDRMIADYCDDEHRWARSEKPPRPKHVDAAEIAAGLYGLMTDQPDLSSWLMAVAIMRLGEDWARR